MVAYLEKSPKNDDFDETVDFLNASPIKYALTVSSTIYVSYIKQFWSTAKAKRVNKVFNDEYVAPSHTKKVFANIRKQGKGFSGTITPLFPFMLEIQAVEDEGSGQPSEPQYTPTTASSSNIEPIPTVASSSQSKKTHKRRKTKRKVT
ncbi:hypothetical protein Tco_1281131, partial [Tanacetum coccineum]